MSESEYYKVYIPVPEDLKAEMHPMAGESLWAERASEHGENAYVLRNPPCHPDLFWGDIVEAVDVEVIDDSNIRLAEMLKESRKKELERYEAMLKQCADAEGKEKEDLQFVIDTIYPEGAPKEDTYEWAEEPEVYTRLTYQKLLSREAEIWQGSDGYMFLSPKHWLGKEDKIGTMENPALIKTMRVSDWDEAEEYFKSFQGAEDAF